MMRGLRPLGATVAVVALVLGGCSTPPKPPVQPSSVSAKTAAGSIDVAWTQSTKDATSFTVYRWAAGTGGTASSSTEIAKVAGTATSYRDYAVQPTGTYRYAVAATNAGGTSDAATSTSTASPTPVSIAAVVGGTRDETLLSASAGRYHTTHPSVTVNVSVPSGNYSSYLDGTLGAGTSGVDVAELDVVWPAKYASDLADIGKATGVQVGNQYFANETAAGTVDGALRAVPWYADVGFLYYRSDLLRKYFGSSQPPTSWSQLDSMAKTIQLGERNAGNANFWGYVWQGASTEALTCNALEWFASSNGGDIINANSVITVNNPNAVAALSRAVGWIHGSQPISPSSEPSMAEEDARAVWDQGNAAFMRNWAYAFSLTRNNPKLKTAFGIATLPSGGGSSHGTLGGWMLGVSSHGAHPDVSANFVLFATSQAEEVHVATDVGYLPSRPDVYTDPAVQSALPFYPVAETALQSAVARPSIVTGVDYQQASGDIISRVHNALTGASSPANALANLESDLVTLTGFKTGSP